MSAPTHTCTADTCWTEHARDDQGRSLCLHLKSRRLGKGMTSEYCGLPGTHRYYNDDTPHEYSIRLGPSPARLAQLRGVAFKSAIFAAIPGVVLGVLLPVVTR